MTAVRLFGALFVTSMAVVAAQPPTPFGEDTWHHVVYENARTSVPALHAFAWGGALMLLVTVLVLSIGARVLANRQHKRMA